MKENKVSLSRYSVWFFITGSINTVAHLLLIFIILNLGFYHLGVFYLAAHLFIALSLFAQILSSSFYMHKIRSYKFPEDLSAFSISAGNFLSLSFIYGILSAAVYIALVNFFPGKEMLLVSFPYAIALPFRAINLGIISAFFKMENFKLIILIQNIIQPFLLLSLAGIFIYTGFFSANIAILSQSITIIFIAILSYILVKKELTISFSVNLFKSSFIPSLNRFTTAFLIAAEKVTDLLIISLLLGFNFLGTYVLLIYLPSFIYILPTSFFRMFYSVASVKKVLGGDINNLTNKVSKYILLTAIPLCFFILTFTDDFIYFISGSRFLYLSLIPLLTLTYLLKIVSWVYERRLLLDGKVWANNFSIAVFLISYVVLSQLFMKQYGLTAAVWIFFASTISELVLKLSLVYFYTKTNPLGLIGIKILLAAAICMILVRFLPGSSPVTFVFLLFIFSVLVILFKAVSIVEIKNLYKIFTKEAKELL